LITIDEIGLIATCGKRKGEEYFECGRELVGEPPDVVAQVAVLGVGVAMRAEAHGGSPLEAEDPREAVETIRETSPHAKHDGD